MKTTNTVAPRFRVMLAAVLFFSLIVPVAAADPAAPTTQPASDATKPPAPAPLAPTTQPATATQPFAEEGFTKTESGLMYKDLEVGTGPSPVPNGLVQVHYRRALADGTQFDSSYDRGKPVKFRVGAKRSRVIPGWEEGLATMKTGGKRVLIIPPHLGYGLRGAPKRGIPPNATLRFEIELLTVTAPPELTETSIEDRILTDTGLRYVDLRVGDGASPTDDSIITFSAATWDGNGTLLSTTSEFDEHPTVQIATIADPHIKEGLMGMKVGGKRKLFIPRRMSREALDAGKPLFKLFVEVELLNVTEPPQPPVMTETPEDQYITTPSGLKYYDIKVGEGASPKETSFVKVAYTGWLADGTVFDSTVTRGKPVQFVLNRVPLKGWIEGISTMKVGGKRKLVLPPDLAYGENGARGIPPDSTLVFEVELLEIVQP